MRVGADPTSDAGSVFLGLPRGVGRGRGVIATERTGLGIARVAAHKRRAARLAEVFRANFGLEPPNTLRRASSGDIGVAGIGPDTWLAIHENAGNAFAPSLQSLLGDLASVSDLSDAYVILRLTGPKVREAMAKLVPIDVHARGFQVSNLAQTVCGYMNVTIWRLDDTPQDGPAFEIWAGRSLARSLHHAVSHAAAEFGFVLEPGRQIE